MTIYFYSQRDEPYGCFSNFSNHGFILDDLWWATNEHYFQAQKFAGNPDVEKIRLARSPKEAAHMGRDRRRPLRRDWEQVKEEIMLKGLRCKFQTHAEIKKILLSTGDEFLVENSPIDYYWGCGQDGSGKNRLGFLLMLLREELLLND